MSYSPPRSREEFSEVVLALLGDGILSVNTTEVQLQTSINLALEFCRDWHADFFVKELVKHQITQTEISNKYIDMPSDILDVSYILSPSLQYGASTFSTVRYGIYSFMLNNMGTLTSRPISGYVMSMSNLEELSQFLSNKVAFRYNPYANKLYLDMNYEVVTAGQYFIIECFFATAGTEIWSDRPFTELTTEYLRRLWGYNLSKYKGSQSLNGVEFNGEKMVADADERIKEIKEEIIYRYSVPNLPFMY
jgi:hypothetical protein